MRHVRIEKLREVSSEDEVVELVRIYLGSWRPEELAEIPPQCRPGANRFLLVVLAPVLNTPSARAPAIRWGY